MQKIAYSCLFALLILFSCEKSTDLSSVNPLETKKLNLKENIALFDVRVRAVDAESFVKELVFADLSGRGILEKTLFYEGAAFSDDGQQFDGKAGDGVFTAVKKSAYNESVKVGSLIGSQPRSLMEAPIVDAAFKKSAELAAYQASHDRYLADSPNARQARVRVIVCDIIFGDDCPAVDWGICTGCCVGIRNCRVETVVINS